MLWWAVASVCMTNLVVAQILESVSATLSSRTTMQDDRDDGTAGPPGSDDGPGGGGGGGAFDGRARAGASEGGMESRPGSRRGSGVAIARRHSATMTAQMAALFQSRGDSPAGTRTARARALSDGPPAEEGAGGEGRCAATSLPPLPALQ